MIAWAKRTGAPSTSAVVGEVKRTSPRRTRAPVSSTESTESVGSIALDQQHPRAKAGGGLRRNEPGGAPADDEQLDAGGGRESIGGGAHGLRLVARRAC